MLNIFLSCLTESSVKNTSSPNKSPPHPTGKGFNPNAPSFVPTQQVLSSSSRPGPSNVCSDFESLLIAVS